MVVVMAEAFDIIKDFIQSFGWVKGSFAIFFFLGHWYYLRALNQRVEDKQGEINRLAEDNRAYRDRYLAALDKKMNYKPKHV